MIIKSPVAMHVSLWRLCKKSFVEVSIDSLREICCTGISRHYVLIPGKSR